MPLRRSATNLSGVDIKELIDEYVVERDALKAEKDALTAALTQYGSLLIALIHLSGETTVTFDQEELAAIDGYSLSLDPTSTEAAITVNIAPPE